MAYHLNKRNDNDFARNRPIVVRAA